jgi:hypothetical protein
MILTSTLLLPGELLQAVLRWLHDASKLCTKLDRIRTSQSTSAHSQYHHLDKQYALCYLKMAQGL